MVNEYVAIAEPSQAVKRIDLGIEKQFPEMRVEARGNTSFVMIRRWSAAMLLGRVFGQKGSERILHFSRL